MQRTRREILEDSMLAMAAALTATPLLAADEPTATVNNSVNDVLRLAILGVNGRGKEHYAAYCTRQVKQRDIEIATICDPDEKVGRDAVEKIKAKTGKAPNYVKDLRAVYDDKTIQLVSIATPNHWHALSAIWALQAGKDVYVEKPVSHNVSEGRRIVDVARKLNRVCQTGTQCRSSIGLIEAMKFLHSGGLGEIESARALCYKFRPSIQKTTGSQPVPKNIDYDLWSGPAPIKPLERKRLHYDWHWIWDYGNGDLGNQGIHQMDIARWALGGNQVADTVASLGGRFGYEDDGQTPNTELTFMSIAGKPLTFEVRGLVTPDYMGAKVGVIVRCKNGYLVNASYTGAVAFDLDGKVMKKFDGGGDHFGNFISAARKREPKMLKADILEGHLSSALCHIGNISYRLGRQTSIDECKSAMTGNEIALETIARMEKHLADNNLSVGDLKLTLGPTLKLDPAKETFVDSAPANAMLTREYRKPFVVPNSDQI